MNIWLACAIQNVACIVGAVYLITHDCPWWGLLCFLLTKSAKTSKES